MCTDDFRILIACEESQRICTAFRKRGFIAYSCDLLECSGGHPEWHIMGDVLHYINGNCQFYTMDGMCHYIPGEWDLIIAHPPCTYICKAGACRMYHPAGVIDEKRLNMAMKAKEFFMKFYDCSCKHVAIENPRPLRIVGLPKCSQIIQPYEYGDPYSKLTMLWLKNLPLLQPTNVLTEYQSYISTVRSSRDRSKTFPGISDAIAEQWGHYLIFEEDLI